MLVIFFRAIILYTTLLVVMRLMGKRQIGEMQPFEFVITLLIAELACIPMSDVSIPLSYGIVSVLAVFILHQIMSFLEGRGKIAKALISGKPSVVVTPDGVSLSELKKNDMDVIDLAEAMRTQGCFSFDDAKYGIFESNGKLSILKNEDGKDEKSPASLSFVLISDGKEIKGNFESFSITSSQLFEKMGMKDLKLKNVEVLTLDKNHRIYLKERGKKYKILHIA